MNHLSRFILGGQSCLLKSDFSKLPLCFGTCMESLKWLSSTVGASADDVNRASPVEATTQTPFVAAYLQCFGTEPPLRARKHYAKNTVQQQRTDYLVQKLHAWIAAFGKNDTENILRLRPGLLTLDMGTVMTRIAAVCKIYGWSKEEGTRAVKRDSVIIALTQERHALWCSQMASLLSIPESTVGRMVLRFPGIITSTPDTIAARMTSLALALGLQTADVQQMVVKSPIILSLSPKSVDAKISNLIHELESIVSFDARKIFVAAPSLLNLSPETMKRKIQALTLPCQSDDEWLHGLQNLKPKSLATYLSYNKKAFLRLQFYQSSAKPRKYLFSSILCMNVDKFNAAFPEYDEWLQRNSKTDEHD